MKFIAKLLPIAAVVSSAMGMTYRDNEIRFSNNVPNSGLYQRGPTYLLEQHRVTNGQDPNNHVIDGALYSRLVFSVGRKGSSDVAGWWSVRVQPDQNTFGSYPGELNFAFGGKLYFTIFIDGASDTLVVNDIFMAQGHSGSSNNWWIGGPKCQRTGSVIKCEARDKNGSGRLWYVLMERGNNTSVDVVSVRDMILVG